MEDRNLVAFTLVDPDDALVEVDLLASSAVPYPDLRAEAKVVDIGGLTARVASIRHLIAMKEAAGRPQDRADIDVLRNIADIVDGHERGD